MRQRQSKAYIIKKARMYVKKKHACIKEKMKLTIQERYTTMLCRVKMRWRTRTHIMNNTFDR